MARLLLVQPRTGDAIGMLAVINFHHSCYRLIRGARDSLLSLHHYLAHLECLWHDGGIGAISDAGVCRPAAWQTLYGSASPNLPDEAGERLALALERAVQVAPGAAQLLRDEFQRQARHSSVLSTEARRVQRFFG